jgi:hypothetical protein
MRNETTNSDWLFLTDHGTVLLSIASDPTISIRELAKLAGVGEGAAEAVVEDLVAEGYVSRRSEAPGAPFEINRAARLRHPLFSDVEIGPLMDALRDS